MSKIKRSETKSLKQTKKYIKRRRRRAISRPMKLMEQIVIAVINKNSKCYPLSIDKERSDNGGKKD